ncbi:MAG TPA: undecaprenyl diphosphate synthase family protein, partial [bacterium]|nr:undecaprenyl diphosphate synthase family protein [bacterium]HOL50340.1 undecaprenyl diphosphate synthase family protein [bacterium]
GGRQEIIDAFKKAVNSGYSVDKLDEISLQEFFYCPELPDVDLVIRTAGEQRLSNFLIWQAIYAEFYFTEILWPDFSEEDFRKALDEFAKRKRKFGGL